MIAELGTQAAGVLVKRQRLDVVQRPAEGRPFDVDLEEGFFSVPVEGRADGSSDAPPGGSPAEEGPSAAR